MHVSTDYVFDGIKAARMWRKTAPALNGMAYKLAGEHFVRHCNKHFVVRTSVFMEKSCRAKADEFH